MRTWGKFVVVCAAVVVAVTIAWNAYGRFSSSNPNVSFSQFLADVENRQITAISIHGDEVVVYTQTGRFRTYAPPGYVGFVDRVIERGVDVNVVPDGLWSADCAPWVLMLVLAHAGAVVLVRTRASSQRLV